MSKYTQKFGQWWAKKRYTENKIVHTHTRTELMPNGDLQLNQRVGTPTNSYFEGAPKAVPYIKSFDISSIFIPNYREINNLFFILNLKK